MRLLSNIKSLRARFALTFGLLFTVFLAIAFAAIYFPFGEFREDEFQARLRDRALTTYKLFVEVDEINKDLMTVIDRNTRNSAVPRQKVEVFQDSTLVYSNSDSAYTRYDPDLFARIRRQGEYEGRIGKDELVGIYRERGDDHYYILASGYDRYGMRKMNFLGWAMITVYLGGIVVGWVVSFFFVKKIIQPLETLKTRLENVNYDSLSARLPDTGQGAEVDSLSHTFNQLLGRLETSFSFQKDFVHYASHELRTPLAAMVGLTENSINSPDGAVRSREVLQQLLNQQKNLTNITNSLLLLSGDTIHSNGQEYPLVRLDELVFRSFDIIQNLFPDASIEVNLEGELSNEQFLMIRANEPLILMAFNNLLKNAIQYSTDQKVRISIRAGETEKIMSFSNYGEDLQADEHERIFTPFYRAANAAEVKGYGLGLALVRQITRLHHGTIDYHYESGMNVFTLTFR